MRGQTGGVMMLGKGAVYSTSIKQKLNATSSTEAEVIGTADILPQVMWTSYFLGSQGYKPGRCIVYQDNMSAQLLETNGQRSVGK